MHKVPSFFGAVAKDLSALESILRRIPGAWPGATLPLDARGQVFAIRAGCAEDRGASGLRAWVTGTVAGAPSPASRDDAGAQAALGAYAKHGAQCFSRLDGNFCLAIHEPSPGRIRLAADLTGAKSLFFVAEPSMEEAQFVVFGSSALEVLRAAAIPAITSATGLLRYLRHGALAGTRETLLRGVHALRRHHCLEIVGGGSLRLSEVPFPEYPDDAATHGTLEDHAQRLRDILLDSVDRQARFGGNVAVACSGGIDSSGILGCLQRVQGRAEPLHVYSYLQRPPAIPGAWDERRWAELAARRAGAQLHSVELETQEIPAMLASTVAAQDFPFGSPVILAQAKLFRLAADNGIDTMLCGHGADLLFGGADTHIALRLAHLVRNGQLLAAVRMLSGARAHSAGGTARLLASTVAKVCGIAPPERWLGNGVPWGAQEWFRERTGTDSVEAVAPNGRLETIGELIERQLGECLGTTTLLYEDCNARSHGLETRLPYMIASLARLSREARPDYLVSEAGQPKYLLRQALRGLVAEEILARSDRIGFAVPVLPWLIEQKKWVSDRYARLQSLPFFRGVSTRDLWALLERGTTVAWRRAFHLWRWIVLLEWSEAHNVRFH